MKPGGDDRDDLARRHGEERTVELNNNSGKARTSDDRSGAKKSLNTKVLCNEISDLLPPPPAKKYSLTYSTALGRGSSFCPV
ncbi:hypothetical protein PILCRDRAFT_223228 [Piloderma croceum F 1598]|uniref:Uncharacterized protein n=1 Tax=Piloderma croceum (strain F 1598) TaxID=765440 RepID=A0A0C3FYT2_PILCF|nr:hypothetical protein PILCRDRAFT_223228 [Piloderma croceum F 1598]